MITVSKDVIKDPKRISSLCHSVSEPVFLMKNGCIDLVVMSFEVYDRLERAALQNTMLRSIRSGLNAIKDGACHDARESLSEVKAEWAIPN